MASALEHWHRIFQSQDLTELDQLLHDEVIFHSPVMHSPQEGKKLTQLYLETANTVLNNGSFKYVREVVEENNAVLEFTCIVEGVEVNGVDMIQWNEHQQITDFKVMVRPLKAMNAIHEHMGAILSKALKTRTTQ